MIIKMLFLFVAHPVLFDDASLKNAVRGGRGENVLLEIVFFLYWLTFLYFKTLSYVRKGNVPSNGLKFRRFPISGSLGRGSLD